MQRKRVVLPLVALAAVAAMAMAVAGCGEDTLKQESAVDLVNKALNQQGVEAESVECPDDVEAKAGETFDCTVTLPDGKTATFTIEIEKVEGDTASLRIVGAERGT
jgi:hypothetical protein